MIIDILKETVSIYWEYNKEFYAVLIDFYKAYDSVDRKN